MFLRSWRAAWIVCDVLLLNFWRFEGGRLVGSKPFGKGSSMRPLASSSSDSLDLSDESGERKYSLDVVLLFEVGVDCPSGSDSSWLSHSAGSRRKLAAREYAGLLFLLVVPRSVVDNPFCFGFLKMLKLAGMIAVDRILVMSGAIAS